MFSISIRCLIAFAVVFADGVSGLRSVRTGENPLKRTREPSPSLELPRVLPPLDLAAIPTADAYEGDYLNRAFNRARDGGDPIFTPREPGGRKPERPRKSLRQAAKRAGRQLSKETISRLSDHLKQVCS